MGYDPAATTPTEPAIPTPQVPVTPPVPEPAKAGPISITVQDESGAPLPVAMPQPTQVSTGPASAMPAPQPATPIPAPASPSPEAPLGLTPPVLDQESLQSKINAHPLFSGTKEPHAKTKRSKGWLAWTAGLIILVIIGGYLAIDSGLVRGASHLPFHIFKQATPTPQPTINTQQNTTNSSQSSQSSQTSNDPYAGWKSYVLSKEKLTFKYPSTWALKDSTGATDTGDSLSLTTVDNFSLTIVTGQSDFSLPAGGATIDQADAIQFTSQPGYLDLYESGSQKTGSVSNISLSKSATDLTSFFATKNAATTAGGNIKILMSYSDTKGSYVSKTLSTLEADANYKDAKLLIESMAY